MKVKGILLEPRADAAALLEPANALAVSQPKKYRGTVQAKNAIPSVVMDDSLVGEWRASLDGGKSWLHLGNTSNLLYVVGSAPSLPPFQTVVSVGCRNAFDLHPNVDNATILSNIWANFATLDVRRADGTPMKYLGEDAKKGANADACQTTAGLVKFADGRCQAWADFFVDVLSAQGVASTFMAIQPKNKTILEGDTTYYQNGFSVKAELAGQSNPSPLTLFNGHAVVVSRSVVYDPSYGRSYSGSSLSASELMWEAAAVDYFDFSLTRDPNASGRHLQIQDADLGPPAVIFTP